MKKQNLFFLSMLFFVQFANAQNGQMKESVFTPGEKRPIYSLGAYLNLSSKEDYPIGINGEFKAMMPTTLFNKEGEQLHNSFITTTFGLLSVPQADSKFGFFDKRGTQTINVAYLMAGYRYYFGVYDYESSNPWQWFMESNIGLGLITIKGPAVAFQLGAGFNLSRRMDAHLFYGGYYHSDREDRNIGGFSFGLSYKFR